jgi:GntR family transcriptional regulator
MTRQLQIRDLPLKAVDKSSPVPLYHQIESDLRELIKTGHLSAEDVLPPEMELSLAYGVGRQTMRMALSRMAADDLIARQAGRGTFVKGHMDRTKFYLDRSFTRQMAEMGLVAHSKVISASTGFIDQDSPHELIAKSGTPCFRLVRLRYGNQQPIGLQTSTILSDRCPDIEKYDFNEVSLYDTLSNDYRLFISRIAHTVSAVVADDFQANLLEIEAGDALLLVKTIAFLDSGQIIEFTNSYYRADKYEYSTTHIYAP